MFEANRQPAEKARARAEATRRTERTSQAYPIDWNTWWPFERATGNALKQLNKRQPKSTGCLDDVGEALW